MNLKNILAYAVVFICILFVLLIAYNNVQPAKVNLKFLGIREFEVAVWVVMLSAFGIGLFVSFIWGLIASAVHGIEALTTKKRMRLSYLHDRYYEEGLRQIIAGNLKAAEESFERILKSDSKNIKALNALGNVRRMTDRFEQAEEHHLKALLIEEEYLPALEGLALDYKAGNKLKLAKTTIEKILNHKDADSTTYRKELADIYVTEEDWKSAVDIQREIAKTSARAHKKEENDRLVAFEYQMASSMAENKDTLDEAIRILIRLKDKNKGFIPVYFKLAEIYKNSEDYANAIKALSEGYMETRSAFLLKALEDIYIDTDQPDDAIEFFRSLSERLPKDLLPSFILARLYYRFEMIDEARSVFERLQSGVTYSPTLEYYVAKTESREKRDSEAVARLKELIRKTNLLDLEYGCSVCGHVTGEWVDRCPNCGNWNTSELTPKNELNAVELKQVKSPVLY